MSAKFKPRKKEAAQVVDDWEASDPESVEEGGGESIKATGTAGTSKLTQTTASSSSTAGSTRQGNAWGEETDSSAEAGMSATRSDGRALWEEANRSVPQPQPVLANRSLPSTVLSPRLYSPGPASSGHQSATAPPPPQILRREKVGFGASGIGADDKNGEKKKSLKEREEEYRKARERIFGTPSPGEGRTDEQGSSSVGNAQQQRKTHATRAKS